jgi:hypothetical protein
MAVGAQRLPLRRNGTVTGKQMPADERYPRPMTDMSPDGLPGLLVVLAVVLGFVSLFVSRATSRALLWCVVAIALAALGVAAFRWLIARRRQP